MLLLIKLISIWQTLNDSNKLKAKDDEGNVVPLLPEVKMIYEAGRSQNR